MASSISISLPTHNVFSSINHPKLVSSISCAFAESIKWKYASNNVRNSTLVSHSGFYSKIPTAKVGGFGIEGSEKEREAQGSVLQPELMPKHVAVIMDGNRRWALEKGLSVEDGYRAGARTFLEMARRCHGMGVQIFTVFAFSTENWSRPQDEIESLISVFEDQPEEGLDVAMEYQGRVSVIGDTSKFPKTTRKFIAMAETITKANKGPHIVIALNYGGRQDILEATKAIASKVKDGKMLVEEINVKSFEEELQTKCTDFPCPDLLIRSSGEKRLSNFMLWQMAHTELHFVDKFFPDFEEEDFMQAMISFQQRRRRFGGHD